MSIHSSNPTDRHARRRQETREESQRETEANMTPMIDVVFLLIIFFLCIDFRVLEAKLPAHLPKDRGSSRLPEEPKERLRLRIVCDAVGDRVPRPAGNSHRLVGHRVHFELGATRNLRDIDELSAALVKALDAVREGNPDPAADPASVVVEPGPGVVYGDVASCVDRVAAAGFEAIHFGGGLARR